MAPVADGDFTPAQRHEVDRAIRAAEQTCRYEFSVFVGKAEEESYLFAKRLHAALTAPDRSILIMVDPLERLLEVVTGSEVRRHLRDEEVELAVLEMQSAFAAGDLVGGLKHGIAMLAEHGREPRTLHA